MLVRTAARRGGEGKHHPEPQGTRRQEIQAQGERISLLAWGGANSGFMLLFGFVIPLLLTLNTRGVWSLGFVSPRASRYRSGRPFYLLGKGLRGSCH